MSNATKSIQTNEVQSPWMSIDTLIPYLGGAFCRSAIYKLSHRGEIPHHNPTGHKLVFHRDEIDAWVRNPKEKPSKEIKGALSRFQAVRQQIQSGSLKTDSTAKTTQPLRLMKGTS